MPDLIGGGRPHALLERPRQVGRWAAAEAQDFFRLYTHGSYQSRDMDFIVAGAVTQAGLDRAMALVGFHRSGDLYVHAQV